MTQVVELREGDAAECAKLGVTPDVALAHSIGQSTFWTLVERDGEPLCWWGYQDRVLTGLAYAWMLSVQAASRHRHYIARESRRLLAWMLETHCEIVVSVDPDYTMAVRWLEWLGFTPCGRNGPMTIMHIERGGLA